MNGLSKLEGILTYCYIYCSNCLDMLELLLTFNLVILVELEQGVYSSIISVTFCN